MSTGDTLYVIVRGVLNGTIVFEKKMIIPEAEIEKVADILVNDHAAAMNAGRLGFVEIETPEEPGQSLRLWLDSNRVPHFEVFDERGTIQ